MIIGSLKSGIRGKARLIGIAVVVMLLAGAGTVATDDRVREPAPSFPAHPTVAELDMLRARYAAERALWPAPTLAGGVEHRELGPLPAAPTTASAATIDLGRRLFEDPLLSASGQVSCLSCHQPTQGFGDGRAVAIGHEGALGKRNSPSLFGAAHRASLFWDGRAVNLQEQALGPLLDPREMANVDIESVIARLNADADYPARFRAAFGTERIDAAAMVEALAAFQSTLTQPTAFDRFLAGDASALTNEQIWGLHLFRTKAGCMNCHSGPLMTDDGFHNLGLSLLGRSREDVGRQGVTKAADDTGKFRTPSLRHVAQTAPYMHNGLIRTLPLVVRFYEVGAGKTRPRNASEAGNPLMPFAAQTSSLIRPFKITDSERQALIAFLEAL